LAEKYQNQKRIVKAQQNEALVPLNTHTHTHTHTHTEQRLQILIVHKLPGTGCACISS
jgi:hypothetical protein